MIFLDPTVASTGVRLLSLSLFFATASLAANLVENSPFIPDGFDTSKANQAVQKKNAPGVATRDLEFRGVYSLNGTYYFNIYNKKDQKGSWLSLEEGNDAYSVLEFAEESNSLSISIDGEVEELALKTPSDKPIPVQTKSRSSARTRQRSNVTRRSSGTSAARKRQPVVRRRVVVPTQRSARQSGNTKPSVPNPRNTETNENLINKLIKKGSQ